MQNELYHCPQDEDKTDRKYNAGEDELDRVAFLKVTLSDAFFLDSEKRHKGAFNNLKKRQFIVTGSHWRQPDCRKADAQHPPFFVSTRSFFENLQQTTSMSSRYVDVCPFHCAEKKSIDLKIFGSARLSGPG